MVDGETENGLLLYRYLPGLSVCRFVIRADMVDGETENGLLLASSNNAAIKSKL